MARINKTHARAPIGQDMNKAQRCVSRRVQTLPHELFAYMAHFLDPIGDQRTLAAVCQTWHADM